MPKGKQGFQKGHSGFWTKKSIEKLRQSFLGKKNHQWKGDKASYMAKHHWIDRHFGQPRKCENLVCSYKKRKKYEWALLKGKKYAHKRENYVRLCSGCHKQYDRYHKKQIII